jgi:diguanylate cyclase (GGDEF)-like protein/PAS domain S-box-containing protein
MERSLTHRAVDPGDAARLFELSADLMVVADGDGNFISVNAAWEEVLGWTPGELTAESFIAFIHPDDVEATKVEMARAAGGECQVVGFENRYRTRSGDWVTLLWNARWDGRRWYGIARDVTARRELEAQALRDPLTGAANRVLFRDHVTMALARLRRRPGAVAVLFLDIDHFKSINDSRGHAMGDEVLRAVASRLKQLLRADDTVGRLGGDEFGILVEGLRASASEAYGLAQRVLDALAEPMAIGDDHLELHASVGVASTADPTMDPDALVHDADVALYRAKAAGRGQAALFDEVMRAATRDRVVVAADLRHALTRHEMRLVYQPFVSLGVDGVVGCEALIRWDHPQRGEMAPGACRDIAEEDGEIVAIGGWVLEEACRQAHKWRREGKDLSVSVNLSARQFAVPNLVGMVTSTLRRTGLPAQALCLEVTETAILRRPDEVATTLAALRSAGVRIALDDFGQGYSSLRHLKTLPVDVVKIDRSFVAGITTGTEDRAVVEAVMSLARVMGLTVIAEGVETPEQAEILRNLGCQVVQGWLYGRPAPPEELVLDGFLPRSRPGIGDPFVIREFMRQIGIPARIQP